MELVSWGLIWFSRLDQHQVCGTGAVSGGFGPVPSCWRVSSSSTRGAPAKASSSGVRGLAQRRSPSRRLFVRVTLQFVELHTVQLLEPLVAELTGEVVVGLRGVLLHVPVQGRALATLVATDLTPVGGGEEEENQRGATES